MEIIGTLRAEVKTQLSSGILCAMRKTMMGLALLALIFPRPGTSQASQHQEADEGAYLFAMAQMHRFQGAYDEALDAFKRAIATVPDEAFVRLEFAEFLFQLGRFEDASEHAAAASRARPENRDALRLLSSIQLRLADRSGESLAAAESTLQQLRALDETDIEVRVTLGRLFLSQARSREAAQVLTEARALAAGDRMIVSLLLDALGGVSEDPSVITTLEELVSDDPGFLQARLALASALDRFGRVDEEVEILKEAPPEVRSNVDFLRQLAFAHYRSGSYQSSLEVVRLWLDKRPGDARARYMQALDLAAMGREEESEQILAQLLAENPDSQQFALTLAEIIDRRGRSDEAALFLKQLAGKLDPAKDPRAFRRVAVLLVDVYVRNARWSDLLELFDSALAGSLETDDPMVLIRSRALEELGREEEALLDLDRLSGSETLASQAAVRRAVILLKTGNLPDADALLRSMSAEGETPLKVLLAESLHEAGFYSRAVVVLRAVDSESADNVQVQFLLGASLERDGRLDEAAIEFRRLLELDSEFAPALNYLGYMWADAGENLGEALDLVLRALELDPDNGAYLDSLGWVYFQLGRLEEARINLERASVLVEDDAIVFEHLGDLYVAAGDTGEAAMAYEKAVELAGDNLPEVERKLGELIEE